MAMTGLAHLAQPAVSLIDCPACRVQRVPRQGRHDAGRHDIDHGLRRRCFFLPPLERRHFGGVGGSGFPGFLFFVFACLLAFGFGFCSEAVGFLLGEF